MIGPSQIAPRSWLRLPARTARLRLTLLYGGLFLACGAVLLTITYLLSEHAIDQRNAARIPASSGVPTLVPVHPVEPPPGSQAAASLATTDRTVTRQLAAQRASDLHHLLVNSVIALALVAVLAILLGWYVAGRVLAPVRTITATARRISASNLDERLALDDGDEEFKQLGDTLNDLFARLEAAFEAQRHFVANASHELRTPIAWEQTLLQVALADPNPTNGAFRDACEKVLAASKQQQGLVEGLLMLATSERGLDHHDPIDLATLADAVLLTARAEAERRNIEITAASKPAPTHGHSALVERLITNLIDNAVRYNNPGGRVDVQTTTTPDGRAQLVVSNTGPEIPLTDIRRLFEPFQRLKTARTNGRTGHGLGLSIVKAIATAHHAQLAAQSQPDGGLKIEVSFPAATPTSPTPLAHTRSHQPADQRAGSRPC
jgi:signal transduction histidine kinase